MSDVKNVWEEEERLEEEHQKNTFNGYYENLEKLGVTDGEVQKNQKMIMNYLKALLSNK